MPGSVVAARTRITGGRPGARRHARPARIVAIVAAAAAVVATVACWGGPGPDPSGVAWLWVAGAVLPLCAVVVFLAAADGPVDRRAWLLLATGLVLYAVAGVWLGLRARSGETVPVPFWTDLIWMFAYGAIVSGVVVAINRGQARISKSVVVDGLLAAFAVMMVASATVFAGLVEGFGQDTVRAATALSYPLWDLALLGAVAAAIGIGGVVRERRWGLLALGAILLAVADIAYLKRAASGVFEPGAWYQPMYFAAAIAFAAAAWSPVAVGRRNVVHDRWHVIGPAVVAAISAFLLVWDHYDRQSTATVILATLGLATVVLRSVLTVRDVKRLADMRRLAMTDDLTGLPNRRALSAAMDSANAAATQTGQRVALLVLDVDRFKELNDALGHDVGDQLLVEIGVRLRAGLPPGTLVARLGGDEFAILPPPGPSAERTARDTADRVGAALRAPVQIGDIWLPTDVSVGIALTDEHGADGDSLLRRADIAMYQAKASRSGCEFYDAVSDPFSVERLALGADLRGAAERGELRVLFQPIVDARSGELLRAEALLRWDHPQRGMLGPDEFLAIAERTGSMRAITTAVLHLAVAQCEAWQRAGTPVGVAVNLAASDLLDVGFPDTVRAILAQSAIEPAMLQLEITEQGVLEDADRAIEILNTLRAIGVGLSVDDFGTGYASLTYLRGLPVDELKIDRSFVIGIATNPDDAAIVRSTITLGHDLGLRVVAEGVEDAETQGRLGEWGADAVQGFHIGRPGRGDDLKRRGAPLRATRRG